jgi:CubicO group peptidase (beta-lactamase class C family)
LTSSSARPGLPALPTQPAGTPWPTIEWPQATDARLDALVATAFDDVTLGQTLAALVVRSGEIVAEHYGTDVGPDSTLISWSMAKSMTHALAGVLVGDGRLLLHEPAAVPEWAGAGDQRGAITLDHLLAMRPGLEFNEDYVDADVSHCIEMLFGSGADDMAHYAASLPLIAAPDTVFNYSSGTSNIVARLLGDVVGRGEVFDRWAAEVLFGPIGVGSATPKYDTAGTFVGSSYVYATAQDFARFGLLYLRDGCWDGRRILPEGWVDHARTWRSTDTDGTGYGSHWWVWPGDRGVFAAQGFESQRIVIVPDRDAIIVRLGKTPADLGPNVDTWITGIIDALD